MFDDIGRGKRKTRLSTRLDWKWRRCKDAFYDFGHTVCNHVKWHRVMRKIRPWEGFDGLIWVMQTHLRHYMMCEAKYGQSTKEYRNRAIGSVKEVLKLLVRMKDPAEYSHRRRAEVDAKYPEYKSLITRYDSGSTGVSGNFVPQGQGWAGMESGKDPREGYFEFTGAHFELASSPDQIETDRILDELRRYHEDVTEAYEQAEADSVRDFERLGRLLKEHLYEWWD